MSDIKKKVEALLFSSARSMSLEELKRLCRVSDDELIKKALQDLQVDYNNRDSALKLIQEGDRWKIQTKEDYFHVIKKVVTETELSKTLMETLAVIAWKYPIKQCDLIKVRTNKAYDHLNQLEEIGYITRQKHGRTKLIKLTERFFAYFDLPPEKLKDKFSDFNQISEAIANKEKEIENMKEDHKKQVVEAKKMQEDDEKKQKQDLEKQEKEIDLISKEGQKVELEQYKPEHVKKEKTGSLDVYESEIKDEEHHLTKKEKIVEAEKETEEESEKKEETKTEETNSEDLKTQ